MLFQCACGAAPPSLLRRFVRIPRRLRSAELETRAAAQLVPVAYWCSTRAAALALPCSSAEENHARGFGRGPPDPSTQGCRRGSCSAVGVAAHRRRGDSHPGAHGTPGAASSPSTASRENLRGAASPVVASASS